MGSRLWGGALDRGEETEWPVMDGIHTLTVGSVYRVLRRTPNRWLSIAHEISDSHSEA
jgi:hypothetical protein